jgi:predicted RNase H-like nuclease (RuvC/YqgF family)
VGHAQVQQLKADLQTKEDEYMRQLEAKEQHLQEHKRQLEAKEQHLQEHLRQLEAKEDEHKRQLEAKEDEHKRQLEAKERQVTDLQAQLAALKNQFLK